MKENQIFDVLIIGGGLAGLTTTLHLSKSSLKVGLIEKYQYPHHKVCGEYVSNEVLPYLNSMGIDPYLHNAKRITKFEITDRKGTIIETNLPLGGFGMSRYFLDNLIYEKIKDKVELIFDSVEKIDFKDNQFKVSTQSKNDYHSVLVVGAHGKRSNVDTSLNRNFISKKSPWLAVKSHYEYGFKDDLVALHNFDGGYCGLSQTESGAVNACYLTTFNSFKKHNNIDRFQKEEMSKNPFLKEFFQKAKPIFEKPLTISQVSFHEKNPVEDHIFMVGDSAGLIHPLCGNGMAMAIHSAKIFSEILLENYDDTDFDRESMEQTYSEVWQKTFNDRLKTGRRIQRMLLNPFLSKVGFNIIKTVPSILPLIIKKTHGTETL